MNHPSPAQIKAAPIRKSITVPAPPSKAFEVFTAGFGRWWPAAYSIGASPLTNAVIEPRAGGRWFEIGEDGSECDWGEVLAWEPPARLVLAWRINADWRFDAGLLTEVEVNFVALGDDETRVDLEHRHLENMGELAAAVRQTLDAESGWQGVLDRFAATVSD